MMNSRFGLYLLVGAHTCAAAGTCFFPNGQEAKADFPCDPGASNSMCCDGSLGTTCLTNNLCRGSDGNLVRGSCTDKNWNSPECAMHCLGANTGGTDLISCSNVTGRGSSYCCNHAVNCCDSGVGRFEVFPDKPSTWATFNLASSSYIVVNTAATSASRRATTTTSTSSHVTTATGTAHSSVPTATPNSEAAAMNAPQGLSVSEKIGIGIGAAIGVMLIAVVLFLQWRIYTRNRPTEESAPSYQETPQRNDADVGKPPVQGQQQESTALEAKRVELPGQV